MKKQDLKDGMILEVRNGERFLLTNGIMRDFEGYTTLKNYSEDLKNRNFKVYDIVKVYKDTMKYSLTTIFKDEHLTLLWERKEIKLTDREIEVLKALKTLGYNYIARGEDGSLYAYENRPEKFVYYWFDNNHYTVSKKERDLFNFITWEDDKPTKIDDLLKELENE